MNRDSITLEEHKRIFIELAEEKSSEFRNLKKGINLDNPKDFRNN